VVLPMAAVLAAVARWAARVLRQLVRQKFCLSILSERSVTMTKTSAPRKELSADALFRSIHQSFQGIPDPRTGKPTISLPDALMSGLAMFALKDPSMLAFDQRRQQDEKSLQMIFHVENVPCDTRMREVLDPVNPEHLRPAFSNVFT
jgi:hypothetical protein